MKTFFGNSTWIKNFLDLLDPDMCSNIIICAVGLLLLYAFLLSRKRVDFAIRKIKSLKNEIEDQYIVKGNDGTPITNGSKKLICIDPSERIEEIGANDISLRHIPSLLTGLGIIGTFLGVSIALYAFPKDINNSTEMMAGMKRLIPAMKTAFITSLAGISSATLYLIYEKWQINKMKKLNRMVTEDLYKNFQIESSEFYLRQQSSLKPTMERMTTATEALQATINNMQGKSTPEMIAQLIKDGLTISIEKYLQPPIEDIGKRLAALDDVKMSSKSIEKSTEQLSLFITGDLKNVFDSLENSIKSSHTAMKETGQALSETNKVISSLNSGLETFVKDMGDTLDLQEKTFKSTSEEVRQNFKRTADTIASQYESINSDMTNMAGTFNTISSKFSEMIDAGTNSFSSQVTGFENMLKDQQQTSTQLFSDIRKLNKESMDAIVTTTKNTLEKAVNETRDTSKKMIEQAMSDISEMGSVFKTISTEFSELIDQGTQSFSQQVHGFEEMLNKQRTLSQNTFKKIIDLNQKSLTDIVKTTKDTLEDAINKSTNSTVMIINKAKESFEDVVNKTNDNLQQTLSGVGNELIKTSDRVKQELQKFREEYTKSLSLFFDQQKGVLEEILQENVHKLGDLTDKLNDAFKKEYDQKNEILDRIERVVSKGTLLTEMQNESIRELAIETVDSNKKIANSVTKTGKKLESINAALKEIASAVSEEVTRQIEKFAEKQGDVIKTYQVEVDTHLKDLLGHLINTSEILAARSYEKEENR